MLRLLAIILIIISPFLLHIWRKNTVNNLNIRIEILRKEASIMWNELVKLRAKYREATSIPVIENRASDELNMRYPRKREIIKLEDLPDER
ncbi:MAG: hypothetical protein E3J23_05335 [Candidatus Stahlbacteria bacterium]|nr:MAG: hypothetical protein E3J23_05335 [Candidatus Stahlbacteria bacterium]